MLNNPVSNQIESIILSVQSQPPVNIFELARLLNVDVKKDLHPPSRLKSSKGHSWGRLVMYPHPVIYYNENAFSRHKTTFVVATILSYYILFNKEMKSTNGCEFYNMFWSDLFKDLRVKKLALKYAVNILVPKPALKKVLRSNTFDGDIENMAKYFGVQPSLMSIALGIPYE